MFLLFPGEPGYRAQSGWPPWLALAVVVLIVLAATVASAMFARRLTDSAAAPALILIVSLLVWQVVVIGGTLASSKPQNVGMASALAVAPPVRGLRDYLVSFALVALVLAFFNLVAWGVFGHDLLTDLKLFAEPVRSPYWLLAWFAVGVGAPIAEELLFRGFLLSALASTRLGFSGAALVCNTIWTLLHAGYTAAGILEVFLIGALFSWIVWWTGSIRVTIFCHALYNSLLVLVLRFAPLPI